MNISVALATEIHHLDALSSDLDWGLSCPTQFHSILELVLLFLRWRQTYKLSSQPTWPSSRPVYPPLGLRLCQDTAQIPEPSDWGPWSGEEDKTLLKPLASTSPARQVAHCTPGLLRFPGLAQDDRRLGHDLLQFKRNELYMMLA